MTREYERDELRRILISAPFDTEGKIDHLAKELNLAVKREIPRPGTFHRVKEGPYEGRVAYVNANTHLMVFTDVGDYDVLEDPDHWPNLDRV